MYFKVCFYFIVGVPIWRCIRPWFRLIDCTTPNLLPLADWYLWYSVLHGRIILMVDCCVIQCDHCSDGDVARLLFRDSTWRSSISLHFPTQLHRCLETVFIACLFLNRNNIDCLFQDGVHCLSFSNSNSPFHHYGSHLSLNSTLSLLVVIVPICPCIHPFPFRTQALQNSDGETLRVCDG